MAIGPEDLYYEVNGNLICLFDLQCESWEEVADYIGEELAEQMFQESDNYQPRELATWLTVQGYEQKVRRR